ASAGRSTRRALAGPGAQAPHLAGALRRSAVRIEAEQLPQRADEDVGVVLARGALQAQGGLMQEPRRDRSGHRLDPLAIGLAEALPARFVLDQYSRHDLVRPGTQCRDRRHDVLGAQPPLKVNQLRTQDALGLATLGLATGRIALHE